MKIIYNNLIPFKGFTAINLFGVIFARRGNSLPPHTINHEKIHTAQMRELGYIGFYILYFVEWVYHRIFHTRIAYRALSFEREAYKHQSNYDYLKTRKPFAQWRRK
ncbi:MAG: hypothetical protein IIV72_08310 [Alistipes sp.]|nr:hypothetical protein [Alistipes sp.]